MAVSINALMLEILQDIRVELLDEFDKNFERGSFFGTKPWPKSRRPGGKSPLIDSGALRRSIKGEISGNRIAFSSSLPYASIHNSGGTLTVTTKMKRFFWAKYIESTGKISKNKSGKAGNNARNRRLSAAASFYKAMALKKVGSKIVIPQRQFLGFHPSLIEPIEEIAGRRLKEYLHNTLPNKH